MSHLLPFHATPLHRKGAYQNRIRYVRKPRSLAAERAKNRKNLNKIAVSEFGTPLALAFPPLGISVPGRPPNGCNSVALGEVYRVGMSCGTVSDSRPYYLDRWPSWPNPTTPSVSRERHAATVTNGLFAALSVSDFVLRKDAIITADSPSQTGRITQSANWS